MLAQQDSYFYVLSTFFLITRLLTQKTFIIPYTPLRSSWTEWKCCTLKATLEICFFNDIWKIGHFLFG